MSDVIEVANEGATCSVWLEGPSWGEVRTATIGRFHCDSAAQGKTMLDAVAADLASQGIEAVIGPMDGDTWHSYRLVAETDGSAPFLMEPVSGSYDREAFQSAGFAPISSYVSSRASLDEAIGEALPFAVDGVTITPWDGQNAAELVQQLYAMSAAAFERNAFFKPLDLSGFMRIYDPVIPGVDKRFVLFAHDAEGAFAGFLFGVPNRLEGPRGKSIVLKTYASRKKGVGRALMDRFHRDAREAGFETVIYALMHVDNASLDRTTRHGGKVFRRYALMGRKLFGMKR